jgi:hypothetical protein
LRFLAKTFEISDFAEGWNAGNFRLQEYPQITQIAQTTKSNATQVRQF